VIVVDSNVVAYTFLEGVQTQLALKVRDLDPDWRLPELWRHEYLNILATYARHGGATLATTGRLWRRASRLLASSPKPVDMLLALELAARHNLSAYDAQFMALAVTLGVRCVTEDRALLKAFPEIAVSMRGFCGN